ncbi:MAG: hypothetical protein FJ095_03615 [Deltaproteobacteria bacterium]|nr:hypothetical protein [Deltaproteobacteria bacterium]
MSARALRWSRLAVVALGPSVVPASAQALEAPLSASVEGRVLHVQACRGGRCTTTDLELAAGLGPATTEPLTLVNGRPALLVEALPTGGPGRFVVMVAQDDSGAPRELLRGFIDRPRGGDDGATRVLLREPGAGGVDVSFAWRSSRPIACGRHVLSKSQRLDPRELAWRPAPTRTLAAAAAPPVTPAFASRGGAASLDGPRLLVATVATSATADGPSGLTDGTLERGWAESADGLGEGEVVVMSSSSDVAIEGFELVVRGRGEAGATPRTLLVYTDREAFHVTMPEDAGAQPEGTGYVVSLATPIRTECVALALEGAYGARGDVVRIAEFRARTGLEREGFEALVSRLDHGGDEARAAEVLLARSGSLAVGATMRGFDALGPAGRVRALDVIESGSCAETARFVVERLVGRGRDARWDADGDESLDALRERTQRCLADSSPILEDLLLKGLDDRERGLAGRELASLVPASSLSVLPRAFDGASPALRARLRDAVHAASQNRRARLALEGLFTPAASEGRSRVATLELLRALGDVALSVPGAATATAELMRGADFRERYLLLQPAARFAGRGDPEALRFLEASVSREPSAEVRAQAARLARGVPSLKPALLRALGDASPRVREAALVALAGHVEGVEAPQVASLLRDDPWPFVRVAATAAFGTARLDESTASALVGALDDRTLAVRLGAVKALGAARVSSAADRVRAVASDGRLDTSLRAAALAALGRLCRQDDASLLYKLASRAVAPELGYDRDLGVAALAALEELRPVDRAKELLPYVRDPRTPRELRAILRRVVEATGRCGA